MNKIPFEFVLEALARATPRTNPMFGCIGVYVGEKIVLALRNKKPGDEDNGVWIATVPMHHASPKKELPSMRSIKLFGKAVSSWQNLPQNADDFEEMVLKACDLILKNDIRIGKVPKVKSRRKSVKTKAKSRS